MKSKPFITVIMCILFLASCQKKEKVFTGIQKKTYTNTQFDKIEISSQLRLKVLRGNTFAIEIEGCANDLAKMKVEQEGNVLQVSRSGNEIPADYIYVTIIMPELSSTVINGAVTGEIGNFDTEIPRLFTIIGAANIQFTGNAVEAGISVSGASVLKMTGNGSSYTASISGASQLLNAGYKANDITMYLSGDAQAQVYTYTSLVGEISGASKLFYWGHPPQVEVTRKGQASIIEK